MNQTPPPDLGRMSAALAFDSARVSRVVDRFVRKLDHLVEAVHREDWGEVFRLSELIAHTSHGLTPNDVTQAAQRVCAAALQPNNAARIRQEVMKLMGACGRDT